MHSQPLVRVICYPELVTEASWLDPVGKLGLKKKKDLVFFFPPTGLLSHLYSLK